jgi:Ran GTPase-activating protein 1
MAMELGHGDVLKYSLWPPSDYTRAKLVERMANNLASLSFFSQTYGRIQSPEAAQHAKRIEEAAFVAAQKEEDNKNSNNNDGVESGVGTVIVRFYTTHASNLMFETLKSNKNSFITSWSSISSWSYSSSSSTW